ERGEGLLNRARVALPQVGLDVRGQTAFGEVRGADPALHRRTLKDEEFGVKSLVDVLGDVHAHLDTAQGREDAQRLGLGDAEVGRGQDARAAAAGDERLEVVDEQLQPAEPDERYG